MTRTARAHSAFTLVEVLIVVVILGILAAIAVPQFTSATHDASVNATYNELQKLRRHVELYRVRNSGRLPNVVDGNGSWGEIVGNQEEYLLTAPLNQWIGGANAKVVRVVSGAVPDTVFQTDYGWIFDPDSGQIYAGGFDGNDRPLPRN